MASRSSHNKNNAGVKRILQEARELAADPSTDYHAAPLEDDIFEWHCTIRGPAGTEFEDGIYHFRIQLPSEYPFRPPSIIMLTPNGRFELNTKICISFTNYHEELWQPAWGIRTAIVALQGFFPLKGEAAVGVGAMECTTQERKRLAKLSREWCCPRCSQKNVDILPDPPEAEKKDETISGSDGEQTNPETTTVDKSKGTPADSVEATQLSSRATAPAPVVLAQVEQPLENTSQGPVSPVETLAFAPPTPAPVVSTPVPSTPEPGRRVQVRSRPHRPPLILDGAIAICLTMLVALLWKRIF